MKKKLFLPLVLICYVLIAVCALSACNDAAGYSAFYGTYQSLWNVGDFTISEDGVTISDGVTSPVSYDGSKLTLEFANTPWELTPYENNDVLVLGDAVSFDTVEIGTRNGYFSGRLLNYSGMSVGEQYTFNADGSYSYIDVSSGGTLQHSGRYALVNGVLFMRGATWLGGSVQCGFYITESYEFYINVYVRQLDSYEPEPGDPVIEYETTDAARGEVQGDTRQQIGEGETGTPVTAVARDGYTFTEWSDGRTDNPRTDSGLELNTTVYASFEPVYDIVFVTTEGGRIASGETSQRIVGDGVTSPVTAEAEPGYRFLGWSRMEDQTALTAEISTSVFNLQWHTGETYTITASFEKIVYTAIYDSEQGGCINGTTGRLTYEVDYEDGYTAPEVTATPIVASDGSGYYVFAGWSDGVEEATRQDVLTEDIHVVAQFEHCFTVTFTAERGGHLEGDLEQSLTQDNNFTATTVTAIPDDGWAFDGWWTGEGSLATYNASITHQANSFIVGDADYIAQFRWLGNTYTFDYGVYTDGGSLRGETWQGGVIEGDRGTPVEAVPDEGYVFVRWSDGRTDNPRTDVATSNVFVEAIFAREETQQQFTLTYTAGEGGNITGESRQTVQYGESGTTVTAVPEEGYEFVRWSDGVTTATRTDGNVTSDITVTVEFRRIELTLTYAASTGGSIVGETSQTVQYGESGTAVTAVPEEGYEFVRWSDGVQTAARTDDNVTSDITVTAEFRRIELTLTYAAGTGGSIIGETSQTVQYGESGTAVTAVPEEGYEFVRWSDGVQTAARTDDNVTADISVTAEFVPIENTTEFAGGGGGAENPYEIATVTHLGNMELYPDAHYVLTADITLPEVGAGESNFTPLFSDAEMFEGSLDGQGHKIVGLTVHNTSTFYAGLFSCIGASGSVTDLVLEDASVGGTNYMGGIAGYSLEPITGCTVTGSIVRLGGSEGNKVFAGGIAGRAEASVDGCVTEVSVLIEGANGQTYAGGIVGYLAYGGSDAPLTLAASGDITVSASATVYAGGLAGYVNDGLTITHSYATGNVTSSGGEHSYAGGLVGNGGSTVTDSYATGDVTSSGDYAGGLVGYGYSVTVTDSYATGDVTSTGYASRAGGLVGDGNTVTVTDSYATGDVTSSGDYAGGLVGYVDIDLTVRNSYSVSCVRAESKSGNVYIGGLAGYVGGSLTLENAHWYGGDGTAAEYAVGYSDDLGIPTSIGSTAHESLEEFYVLADALNAEREDAVWEHKGEDTLPTLIEKDKENEEEIQ